jgi:hypothetical protein
MVKGRDEREEYWREERRIVSPTYLLLVNRDVQVLGHVQ